MKIKTFRERLASDPNFRVSYIVSNNEVAVAERLRAEGFNVSTSDDIFRELNALLAAKEYRVFNHVLSVPMRTDGLSAAELAVVMEVGQGLRQAHSAEGSTKSNPYGIEGTDIYSDGGTVPDSTSGGSGNGAANFATIFGSLAGGIADLFSAGVFAGDQEVKDVPTATDAATIAEQERQRKAAIQRNWMIGGGILLALVLAFVTYKDTKGKK